MWTLLRGPFCGLVTRLVHRVRVAIHRFLQVVGDTSGSPLECPHPDEVGGPEMLEYCQGNSADDLAQDNAQEFEPLAERVGRLLHRLAPMASPLFEYWQAVAFDLRRLAMLTALIGSSPLHARLCVATVSRCPTHCRVVNIVAAVCFTCTFAWQLMLRRLAFPYLPLWG